MVAAAGDTATESGACATVTTAEPDAVTVASPLPAAVTSPEALTVATAAALLAQVTAAPAIVWPFWSRTSVESCTVAPSAGSSAVAGLTVTVVGRGGSGGGVGGSVVPSPQAYAHRAADSAAAAKTKIR